MPMTKSEHLTLHNSGPKVDPYRRHATCGLILDNELWAQVEKEAGKLGMRNKSEYVNRAITDYMKRTIEKADKDEK